MASIAISPHISFSCRTKLVKLFKRNLSVSLQRLEAAERPSIAPKPCLDIKHIRQNPDLYSRQCIDRNYKDHASNPQRIIELCEQRKKLTESARSLRQRNNKLQRVLTNARPDTEGNEGGGSTTHGSDGTLEAARVVKKELLQIENKDEELQLEIYRLAIQLPNLTSAETPIGAEANVVGYINTESWEHPGQLDGKVGKSHMDIGKDLQLLDFGAAGLSTGWGWYFLTNEAALLEQALVQYALSVAMKRGWMVVSPPSVVYTHISEACGFQPRDQEGGQQVYTIKQRGTELNKPELSLTGTAEISLAGMKVKQVLEEKDLPLKMVGSSRCYRAEAGARGIDTKGLYRVHEFTKVEMFAWTMPEDRYMFAPEAQTSHSKAVFDEMLSIQTEILQSLDLHCRILEMPSMDLGASATRKRDIEAFFPSRQLKNDGWGEVTSASMCADYQSRRLSTRVQPTKPGRGLEWPHTVNGTALAVPRVLAAILENGWDKQKKCVLIPEVLRPWMGGLEYIQEKALKKRI